MAILIRRRPEVVHVPKVKQEYIAMSTVDYSNLRVPTIEELNFINDRVYKPLDDHGGLSPCVYLSSTPVFSRDVQAIGYWCFDFLIGKDVIINIGAIVRLRVVQEVTIDCYPPTRDRENLISDTISRLIHESQDSHSHIFYDSGDRTSILTFKRVVPFDYGSVTVGSNASSRIRPGFGVHGSGGL